MTAPRGRFPPPPELSYQCRHFLNTRSAFTTPAAEDEEELDENQTTTFDAETAEDTE
jgi:hypothetical protein